MMQCTYVQDCSGITQRKCVDIFIDYAARLASRFPGQLNYPFGVSLIV
jgi:beta-glucosidase/6-phospho-beta-glucosidase/beta-galactosidase